MNSGRGPFASALRNLAKQADIKEEEITSVGDGRGGGNNTTNNSTTVARGVTMDGRSSVPGERSSNDDRNNQIKKRTASPAPPEKV